MCEKTWRAGAIGHTGHGNFGHGLHLPYQYLPGVEMVAVADPDEAGRAKAIEQTGAQRGYADYAELLEKEELDIVSVCPRHAEGRAEIVLAAAEAGCHIYCEKPFARDLVEADRLLAACVTNQVKIAVSHQSRYVEPYLEARAMLLRGDLGQLLNVIARGKEDRRGGGEDMMVLGTHMLDMMRFLAGDPEWVFGTVTRNGQPVSLSDVEAPTEPIGPVAGDAVHALYALPDGATGQFISVRDQGTGGQHFGISLIGSEASISIRHDSRINIKKSKGPAVPEDGWDYETIEVPNEAPVPDSKPMTSTNKIDRGNCLAVWDLMRAAEEDREPISSGWDARFALEMILGVYTSHLSGKRVCFPIEDRKHPLDTWNS